MSFLLVCDSWSWRATFHEENVTIEMEKFCDAKRFCTKYTDISVNRRFLPLRLNVWRHTHTWVSQYVYLSSASVICFLVACLSLFHWTSQIPNRSLRQRISSSVPLCKLDVYAPVVKKNIPAVASWLTYVNEFMTQGLYWNFHPQPFITTFAISSIGLQNI